MHALLSCNAPSIVADATLVGPVARPDASEALTLCFIAKRTCLSATTSLSSNSRVA